jgi:hypothetical protein
MKPKYIPWIKSLISHYIVSKYWISKIISS